MKIIRYQDRAGQTGYAAQQTDGSALKLAGDIYQSPKLTDEKADVAKLLAPIQPSGIICIGAEVGGVRGALARSLTGAPVAIGDAAAASAFEAFAAAWLPTIGGLGAELENDGAAMIAAAVAYVLSDRLR